jgi:3-hydroxy-3-methylglutaryl CoA synthase/uncharacterized OB-fold protein
MFMGGILAYGTYVPYWRLQRSIIAQALGAPPGKGTRSVASYDEDTTSMGAEAARAALSTAPGVALGAVAFATTDPAYLDKTNATAIHAACNLDASVRAFDTGGAVRSGMGALLSALDSTRSTLVVLSDIRTGLPGGADEREGGDAASAILCGPGPAIAEVVSSASATGEFLERWRIPGELASLLWEERFGEHAYQPLVEQAVNDALKGAGMSADTINHLVVTGTHPRAIRAAVKGIGARPEALVEDLFATVGNAGTAHVGLILGSVLDRADPGEVIAVVSLADGVDVLLLRTTEALRGYRPQTTVADLVLSGREGLSYSSFLTWRGMLRREPPRRPDPERPAAPPSLRASQWKFGFIASRCEVCGFRHLPPQRVCVKCHAADQMMPERLADVPATIATYTVDRLAYSLSPPVVAAVVDFDGGGRFQCELTDVDPASVAIGDRVEMTFRRLFTAGGVHDYFWKARPIRGGA